VDRPGDLAVHYPPQPSQPVGESLALQQSGCDLNRRGDEKVDEIGELLCCCRPLKCPHGSGGGKFNDAYWIAVDSALRKTSQVSGTRRCHCSLTNSRTKKAMPLIVHGRLTEKCHQRARPMEWRRPGMPRQPGSVTQSSLVVQMRSEGRRTRLSPHPAWEAHGRAIADFW
jgi:hypothetical protein